ncbi:putative hexose transporter [Xylariaceae sp. FL0016]|nr:putative hexose transporter [Xylariaceae sp. FL0016]
MAWGLDTPVGERPPKGHFHLAGRTFLRKKWWKEPQMRKLYFYILALILTNTANGYDNSMMNGLQSLGYWQDYFDHPKGSLLGLFNCVMSVGALCGLVLLPFALDKFGRKPALVFGSMFMLVGIALQTASVNFGMFVGARLLLGFGDIIVIVTAPLLIAEIAPSQDRAILVTLNGATYHSGAFIAAWVTYGTLEIPSDWSWRAPSLIQAVFTIFMLCIVYWIPESPRYHIAHDQPEKALKMLSHYHAGGDEHDEVVQLEMAEITSALALERVHKNSFSFLDFTKTRGNRKRLIIILSVGVFSQWSGNGLVSYYLNLVLNSIGITDSRRQLVINGGMTTYGLGLNLFFSFFVDRWGRRPIYLLGTIGMLVAFTIWTILSARYEISPGASLGNGVLAMIFIYNLAYNSKSGLLASYTTEILPYHMRAKGFTLMEYGLYISLFFNQYVNPIAMENIHWRYYIFYCCFLVLEIVVIYFFYPETRYLPLEEVAKVFDGDDVAQMANVELEKHGEKGFASGAEVRVEQVA